MTEGRGRGNRSENSERFYRSLSEVTDRDRTIY